MINKIEIMYHAKLAVSGTWSSLGLALQAIAVLPCRFMVILRD